ncbi:MAG: hypothetical protein ABI632_07215 [Pseudolysinimonas sp.]
MGFGSLRALVTREDTDGASRITSWRKQPSVVTAAGFWQDLSMAPGNPKPNYYASAPQVAATLAQSTDGGLWHGSNVAPSTKHLRKWMAMTVTAAAVPLPMTLCDYLLYYPFLDESVLDEEQVMVQTQTLTRYVSGDGVQMMAVVVAGHTVGTGTLFTVNYTNSLGVAGRTSGQVQLGTQFVNGTIATTANATLKCNGPFIPLQARDLGVRSIEGITFSGVADVGLITLVLVKPLADLSLRTIDAPVEVDFLVDRPGCPQIVDDAYLNFICLANGSLSAAPIHGVATYVWS